jgi:MFS family permease
VSFSLVVLLVEEMVPPETIDTDKRGKESKISVQIRDPAGVSKINPVLVLGLGTFILAATITMFASLEDPVNNRLNQSSLAFGAQFSAGVLANVLFQIPAGRLSDKIGRKPLIVAGFIVLIPSLLAQAYILSSVVMLFARAVVGVSVAFVFPTSLALAGDMTEGEKSGATLSILTAAFSLGIAFGPVTSGILYSAGSFETPFLVSTVGGIIGLLVTIFGVYEPTEN